VRMGGAAFRQLVQEEDEELVMKIMICQDDSEWIRFMKIQTQIYPHTPPTHLWLSKFQIHKPKQKSRRLTVVPINEDGDLLEMIK
jgi:hypothetical protein